LECADGEVTWNGRRYVVRIDGEELWIPRPSLARVITAAGPHRVYFLEPSRVALALEPLADFARERRAALLAVLARTNGFAIEWLEALRTGAVPVALLARSYARATTWTALLAACALVPLLLGMADHSVGLGVTLLVAFLIPGVIFGWLRAQELHVLCALRGGHFKTVEGNIGGAWITDRPGPDQPCYALGNLSLQVKRAAKEALIEGLTYRMYYLEQPIPPYLSAVLAIEPVEQRW
jgi:hypothetical protein